MVRRVRMLPPLPNLLMRARRWHHERQRLASMTREARDQYLADLKTAATTAEPGIMSQAWNYSEAVLKWSLAGSPVRSPERIEEILSICKACPFYLDGATRPRCKLCGCSINNSAEGTKNKIAMATTECPHKPPKWEAEA